MHQNLKINILITVGLVIQGNIVVQTLFTDPKEIVLKDIIVLLARSLRVHQIKNANLDISVLKGQEHTCRARPVSINLTKEWDYATFAPREVIVIQRMQERTCQVVSIRQHMAQFILLIPLVVTIALTVHELNISSRVQWVHLGTRVN
jgi:hypothetical protein